MFDPDSSARAREGVLNEPDYQFMRELLSDYQQGRGDDVYQTVRLEGARLADEDGHGEASVHIYEAYWADLSRVSDRLYRIIGEFYQLILHVPFLGLHAIDLREHASDNEQREVVVASPMGVRNLPLDPYPSAPDPQHSALGPRALGHS